MIITDFLLPALLGKEIESVDTFTDCMSGVVGNHMAKSALELAFWDLVSQSSGKPVYRLLGGSRTEINAGVSVGLFDTVEETLDEISTMIVDLFLPGEVPQPA